MISEPRTIFDRTQLTRQRQRAARNFADHDFLFQLAGHQLAERLGDVKRQFDHTLVIGSRGTADLLNTLQSTGKISNKISIFDPIDEILPEPETPYDLVISVLELHTINDLPGMLTQIRLHLKPDGLFCAALLGGETLHELRDCLQAAELALRGGVSPRVFPFADKPQIGGLMQRARFALPVIDSEIIRADYPDLTRLLHDLRGMGEGNAITARDRRPLPTTFFQLAEQIYRKKYGTPDGRITATFEIIHMIGWAPSASQPQALKPGSAQIRLADALQTQEIKTPD